MAFNFGAPAAAAPAPAAGGFSFGGAAAPAAPSTSLFGAPAPAAAPAGGLFGAPAPAGGGLFGAAAPAPAAGGGLFGAPAAPAAGGGLFGAPAPATAGLFGATPAPAAGGLFGATPAPAPAAGGLFGAPVAAAPQMQQMQQQQQQQQPFSGNTPYAQLPPTAKQAIDQIYQLMMQHRRTLASVKTMAPSLLTVDDAQGMIAGNATHGENLSPADAAAGSPRRSIPSSNKATTDPSSEPLPQQMVGLQTQIQTLLQSAETNLTEARQLKTRAGEATVQAKMHGAWPMENVAARRGVALSSVKGMLGNSNSAQSTTAPLGGTSPGNSSGGTPASATNVSGMTNIDAIALQQIMDIRAAHVDRIESMPSPYFWEVLHNFEQRVVMVQRDVEAVRARLAIAEEAERVQSMGGGSGVMRMDETSLLLTNARGDNFDVMTSLLISEGSMAAAAPISKRLATLARSQSDLFLRIAAQAAHAHEGLDEVKLRYQRYCQTTKGGYYEDPFLKSDVEEVSREREMQQRIMEEQLATAPLPVAQVMAAPAAPSASTGGLFGQPAPATTGLFGAPSPAPAGGGLFGAPAPAPAGGGLFGAPAPAPAGGGLFGAPAPAPSAGGLFGAPAPAPSTGGLFGPAPAGGGLFGAAAPAPAAGGLFGSTAAPAPAGGGLFGSTAAAPSGNLFGAGEFCSC